MVEQQTPNACRNIHQKLAIAVSWVIGVQPFRPLLAVIGCLCHKPVQTNTSHIICDIAALINSDKSLQLYLLDHSLNPNILLVSSSPD
jgi:hypothetical protein